MYFQANVIFTDKIQENANSERIKSLLTEALSLLVKENNSLDINEILEGIKVDDSK